MIGLRGGHGRAGQGGVVVKCITAVYCDLLVGKKKKKRETKLQHVVAFSVLRVALVKPHRLYLTAHYHFIN